LQVEMFGYVLLPFFVFPPRIGVRILAQAFETWPMTVNLVTVPRKLALNALMTLRRPPQWLRVTAVCWAVAVAMLCSPTQAQDLRYRPRRRSACFAGTPAMEDRCRV